MEKKGTDPNVDFIDILKEDIDKIMWMWQGGVSVRAIGNYFKMSDKEINQIIDAYQAAYI